MKEILFGCLIIGLSNVAYAETCQGFFDSYSATEFYNQALTYSSDNKGGFYGRGPISNRP